MHRVTVVRHEGTVQPEQDTFPDEEVSAGDRVGRHGVLHTVWLPPGAREVLLLRSGLRRPEAFQRRTSFRREHQMNDGSIKLKPPKNSPHTEKVRA